MDTTGSAFCDECGPATPAYYMASLSNGGALTFCIHCTNHHREALESRDAVIFQIRELPS